jgi:hypothetical protein
LPDAVFKDFERDTEVEAVLNEGLAGGVVTYLFLAWQLQLFCERLDGARDVTQEVLIAELISEVETTGIAVLPLVDDVPRFRLDCKRDAPVGSLGVA